MHSRALTAKSRAIAAPIRARAPAIMALPRSLPGARQPEGVRASAARTDATTWFRS